MTNSTPHRARAGQANTAGSHCRASANWRRTRAWGTLAPRSVRVVVARESLAAVARSAWVSARRVRASASVMRAVS
jgi:hypothetical protein